MTWSRHASGSRDVSRVRLRRPAGRFRNSRHKARLLSQPPPCARILNRSERWDLAAGQAQKEFTHNEALQTLDLIVAAAVEELPRSSPPSTPEIGACYIVGSSPSGAWAGKAQCIAGYTSGGWRFVAPLAGMTAYVKATGVTAYYRGGAWDLGSLCGTSLLIDGSQVVGPRLAAISGPTGGANVDLESRSTINQILAALRQHGLIES